MSDDGNRRPGLVLEILLWVGLATLAVGVVLGFRPVTAEGYACGTPFSKDSALQIATVRVADACDNALGDRRQLAFGSIAAGGVVAAVTAWARTRRS